MHRVSETVAEKSHVDAYDTRRRRKSLTPVATQPKTEPSPRCFEFGARAFASECAGRRKLFWFRPHAFERLSDDRGAHHPGRGGGLRALSTGQPDPVGRLRGRPAAPARLFHPSSRPKPASRRLQRQAIVSARVEGDLCP